MTGPRTSKTEVFFALNQMLLDRANAGEITVLIVDEAHNLEWDVLEEIRLLGNLENRRGKLLQIILAGQQEFDRKLDAPEYRQFKQRIALRSGCARSRRRNGGVIPRASPAPACTRRPCFRRRSWGKSTGARRGNRG